MNTDELLLEIKNIAPTSDNTLNVTRTRVYAALNRQLNKDYSSEQRQITMPPDVIEQVKKQFNEGCALITQAIEEASYGGGYHGVDDIEDRVIEDIVKLFNDVVTEEAGVSRRP